MNILSNISNYVSLINSRSISNWLLSFYIFVVWLSLFGIGVSGFQNIISTFNWLGLHDVADWINGRQKNVSVLVSNCLTLWAVVSWFLSGIFYAFKKRSGNLISQLMIAFSFFSALLIDMRIISLLSVVIAIFLIIVVRVFKSKKEDNKCSVIIWDAILPVISFAVCPITFLILSFTWFCDDIVSDNN